MDEKQRLSRNATVKILSGMALTAVMRFTALELQEPGRPDLILMGGLLLLRIFALVLFIWGCFDYARSKGYSIAYGFFGFLGCIGLLILALLRDKWKPPEGPVTSETNYTRDPNRL